MFPPKSPLEQLLSNNYDGIKLVTLDGEALTIWPINAGQLNMQYKGEMYIIHTSELADAIINELKLRERRANSQPPTTEP